MIVTVWIELESECTRAQDALDVLDALLDVTGHSDPGDLGQKIGRQKFRTRSDSGYEGGGTRG